MNLGGGVKTSFACLKNRLIASVELYEGKIIFHPFKNNFGLVTHYTYLRITDRLPISRLTDVCSIKYCYLFQPRSACSGQFCIA